MSSYVVTLRNELTTLTGDYRTALVLGHMISLSEELCDVDAFIHEEIERFHHVHNELHHGWFYKKAADLSDETFMHIQSRTMRQYLSSLVQSGWLFEKRNPASMLDRTLQYRVNLAKIERDLRTFGLSLSWCSFSSILAKGDSHPPKSPKKPSKDKKKDSERKKQPSKNQSDDSKNTKSDSESKNLHSKSAICSSSAVVDLRQNPAGITKVRTTPMKDTQRTPASSPSPSRDKHMSLPIDLGKKDVKEVKKDLEKQQQNVREQIMSLFGIQLSLKSIQILLRTAQENDVELADMVENTHAYHTQVDPCRNIFGAIKYAIEHGGWVIYTKVQSVLNDPYQSLPKAVRRQLEKKARGEYDTPEEQNTDPVYLEKVARLKEKVAKLVASRPAWSV